MIYSLLYGLHGWGWRKALDPGRVEFTRWFMVLPAGRLSLENQRGAWGSSALAWELVVFYFNPGK
ncbi:MAG: hypothetical protein ACNS60_02220 [Candidatus Cyclobacteriaceae bacterium M2_1C_046]